MRKRAPFQPEDLSELDARVLSKANSVCALREIFAGNRDPGCIQMRHDVDNASAAFPTALRLAEWEAERGYRSTYYLLHTARYWPTPDFGAQALSIQDMGHEVGIHLDAVAHATKTGGSPHYILETALSTLRDYGLDVKSAVGHGNHDLDAVGLTNDAQLWEFAEERGSAGKFERVFGVHPLPLSHFGLDFEAVLLGRGFQLTDSGGGWVGNFEKLVAKFESRMYGQMHFNMHPDWWGEAV